jgi:hypothetical protein
MSNDPTFDPRPLQRLLESAFAVQESGFSLPSLSAIVDLQRAIVAGQLPLDAAMQRIAEQARSVAAASGIAIGFVEGDQLVYRAGSGSAASYKGRRVMATLTIPARNKPRAEILRVEDASCDNRIEAAICQQFEAKSLLILPIYSDHLAKGVLQVFFKEAHTFHEQEVAIYRLFAGLVGEALAPGDPQRMELAAQAHGPFSVPETSDASANAAGDLAICETCGAPLAECERVVEEPAEDFSFINAERVAAFVSQRSMWAQALAAAAMLAVIAWGVHREHSPVSVAVRSPQVRSLERKLGSGRDMEAKAQEGDSRARFVQTNSALETAGLREKIGRDGANQRPVPDVIVRRLPVPVAATSLNSAAVAPASTGVKHFGRDVTVRYFSPRPGASQGAGPSGATEVRHLSDDVTVRYFKPKAAEHPAAETASKPSTTR